MKKFRFRLATLQRLREIHRNEVRAKLAEAYQAEQMLDQQIELVMAELEEAIRMQRRFSTAVEPDINMLLETQRYQSILRGQQATMKEQRQILSAEVERRRQTVVEADQQVRVLEKLSERQQAEYRQNQQRAERKEMDEIASRCGERD